MLFNRKLSKYISVVLASSAFCSNSLVGAITDEEFEKYRKISVYFPRELVTSDELPTVFEGYKLILNNDKLKSDLESNIKAMSLYSMIFNTKIDVEINNEFNYNNIIRYTGSGYIDTNIELIVRAVIYALMYDMKLSDIRYIFDSNHYDKVEQSESFKKVVYSFFDCLKLLRIFDESYEKYANYKYARSHVVIKFVRALYRICNRLSELGEKEIKNNGNTLKIKAFVTQNRLYLYKKVISTNSFYFFHKSVLFDNVPYDRKNDIKKDIHNLVKNFDDILNDYFFYDKKGNNENRNRIYTSVDENDDKGLYDNIELFFKYIGEKNKKITCEQIKEGYVKAHEKLKHNQEKCNLFGCKEILENPVAYYFKNHRIVISFFDNLFEYIKTIVKSY